MTPQEPTPSPPGSGPPPPRRTYAELDGVRGLSILFVLFGHAAQFRLGLPGLGELAALGVMIFFVLSGFLITDVLCGELIRTGSVSLKKFYIRRALRLLPALTVFLLAVLAGIGTGIITDVPWHSFAAAVLYLRNIFGRDESLAHLWSLSLEEQFYLVWPITFALLNVRRALWISISSCIGIIAFRTYCIAFEVFDHNTGVFYLRPWFRFDSLLAGCVLGLLWNHSKFWQARLMTFARYCSFGWPIFVAVAWTLADHHAGTRPIHLTVQGLLATALVLGALGGGDGWINSALRSTVLRGLGALSYSIYLWQQPFLVTKSPDWGLARELPMAACLVFVLAAGSYFAVERPFLTLKEFFKPNVPGSA